MRLLLPSLDALLLDATLDAIAASARAVGDSRSLSQLRADAITGMTLRTLQGSQNLACRTASAGDVRTSTTGMGAADLLPDGVPLAGLLGALSGLVEPSRPWWTPSGITPVFPPPGITVNVDVTVPLNQLLPEDGSEGLPACDGRSLPTSPGGGAAPVGSGATTPGTGGGSSLPGTGGGSGVRASAGAAGAAEVVIGAGRVAVPAITARALALGGSWRRLVTDPLSGAVLDVGRAHYRPPAALRDLVQARDTSCTFPGCTVPASRCDIDHVRAWADGGTTSLNNLTVLCQAHHRLKHTPGWTLSRQDGDALVWTTPTGHRYRRDADGTITLMAHRLGPRQLAVPAQRVPEGLAQAVDDAVVSRLRHGLKLATAPGRPDSPGRPGRPPQVTSRGPRPGQVVGAFEAVPYPDALHDLGLAPLLDEIPPF